MFKQFLKVVEGADFYMITSLLIFFIFFILVGLYLLLLKKNHVKYMSNLPLDDEHKIDSSSDANSKS
jgi:cbb3-type cytochrome oxidase subunit 3